MSRTQSTCECFCEEIEHQRGPVAVLSMRDNVLHMNRSMEQYEGQCDESNAMHGEVLVALVSDRFFQLESHNYSERCQSSEPLMHGITAPVNAKDESKPSAETPAEWRVRSPVSRLIESPSTGLTTVLYLRSAICGQGENPGLAEQRSALQAWVDEHGYKVLETFVDEGVSAHSGASSRPGFDAMLAFCQKNPVHSVLIYRRDRLARSFHIFEALAKQLLQAGVNLQSLDEAESGDAPLRQIADFPTFLQHYTKCKTQRSRS